MQDAENTETIIYQGQPVQATLVNHLSGNIPTSTGDMDGDEDLFRDKEGRYYLRRSLNWLDDDCHRPASGRTLTHRLSVNAAILWATTRLNSETLDLRRDAALALPARTAEGSHAVTIHLTPKQLRMVRRVAKFDHEPSVAAWIMREVEAMVVCTADSFNECQNATRAAWNQGKEVAA